MKFKERVLIFSSLHEIFIATLPIIALFFKLSEDKKSRIDEIALFSIAVIIALLTFIVSDSFPLPVKQVVHYYAA
jgi:hypothetical protein